MRSWKAELPKKTVSLVVRLFLFKDDKNGENNKMNNKNDNFITAKEASKKLGIPLSTLYRLSQQGRIKVVRIGGRWYYPETAVDNYLSCQYTPFHSRLNQDPPERREYPRMNCYIECFLSVPLPNREIIPNGIIKNMSGGGLLINTDDSNILLEDPLDIRFEIYSNVKTIISVKARVIRKNKDMIGIKFRKIDESYKDQIIKYIG